MIKKVFYLVLVCIATVNVNAALVAHWKIDEAISPSIGVVAIDSSGNGHHGVYTEVLGVGNGPTTGIMSVDPFYGTAAKFSYISGALYDGIDVGNFLGQYDNDFTVAAWIKPDSFSPLRPILGNENHWRFYTQNGKLYLTTRGVKSYSVSLDGYLPGKWIHVVVVMDSDNDCSFYVNGSLIGFVAGNNPASGADRTSPYMIGRISAQTTWNNGYIGCIDEVRFYDDSLTANEIAVLAVTNNSSNVAGDFTNNGVVDFKDIVKLGASWYNLYDINDLTEVANNWLCGTSPRQIIVMTYNIHHGEGTDGVLDLDRIAQIIEQSGVDIVGLQEVDNGRSRSNYVNQAQWLANELDMYYVFGPALDATYGNAILSKYPLVHTENYPLPQYADEEKRACILAFINVEGKLLPCFSTHLDHTTTLGVVQQAYELVRLSGLIGNDKILMGDLNSRPYEGAILILEQKYVDTFDVVNNLESHIDYVFISNNFDGNVIYSNFIVNALTQVASDHYPVLADIISYPY